MINEPKVPQYLTKNELYEEFGRHPRTLTKDITKAIARGDQELLALAQLHTKTGRIIEATEVNSNTWKELSDEGENPAWYFSPEFVEIVRQRNSKKPQRRTRPVNQESATDNKTGATHDNSFDENRGSEPALPSDAGARAVVLEHLQFQSLKHANENKELMGRILKLVETNQQLQSQTNSLFNQFQVALQEGVISSAVVPAKQNTTQRETAPSTKSSTQDSVIVVEEKVVATTKSKPVKTTKQKRKSPKAKTSRVKSGAAKKTSGKKNVKPRTKAKVPKAPQKRKGFLNRLFGNSNG
jgi:hypothetical protein